MIFVCGWGLQGDAVERPHRSLVVDTESGPAPTVALTVAASDSPLVLYSTLDGKAPSATSGSVRLVLPGSSTVVLRMLASDLRGIEDPALRIDRGDVSIPTGTTLTGDLPHNVRITVSNIPRPGTYRGQLTFYVASQTAPALELPIELRARARPEVQPVQAAVTHRVAVCSSTFSCWLAARILPESAVEDEVLIQLENKTREPVTISESALLLRGEHGGATVPASVLAPSPPLPRVLPANQVTAITLHLARNQLAPDRYQGSLRMLVSGSDDPVSVSLDLAVRHGPMLPMLVLLLGIAFGRLVQKMDTPEVQKQMRMMDRFQTLAQRAESVENPTAVQLVRRQLARVKAQIEASTDSEEALQLALDKANALIDLLVNIEELETRAARASETLRAQVSAAADEARKLLVDGKFSEAEDKRRHMESLLADDRMGGEGESAPLFDGERQLAILQSTALAAADSAWRRVKTTLRFLSGLTTTSADIRYWLMRPLLSVALLVLLSLLGLQQLYVSAGTTFGSTGLYDYLGLLVWGLSADIAQRSLHSLPGLSGR